MELIYEFNPWWEHENWERRDEDIEKWKLMKIRWIPRWLKNISLRPFSLNFVVGPRQVGKTTGIKLLIRKLIKNGTNPYSIFYLNLEVLTDISEFREILNWYMKMKIENKIEKSLIFLDEVTKVRGWHRILKAFIDLGKLKNDVIITSGSSSLKILKYAEAFPGRRGAGKDIVVLPLSFPEYLEALGIDVKKPVTYRRRTINQFQEYLRSGGFPKSINKREFFFDFISALESEIENLGKSVNIAKQIIASVLDTIPSATSYHAIASRLGFSHKTIMEYLEVFEDLFLAKVVFLKENKRINYRREKKIFFRDPFILKAFSMWCNKEMNKSALFEAVVQEHLLRRFGEIFYYRNKYEIDCIAGDKRVEVKAGKPHRRYPRNVTVLEEEDIPFFLLELFK